ncbi:hypothetical protein [Clostridium sp.]|uniref:hypothetical protein n=1 Tax=Clostridium sp. TaxID=1506 RepID=UPI0026369F79|nr:hypothetical protein [Clostridium sp.]
MRNGRKKYLKYIWTIALSLEVILYLIFYLFRLKICLFNIGPNIIVLGLLMLILILPMMFFDYNNKTLVKVIYNLAIVILTPMIIFGYIMLYSEYRYFTFKSPNKVNTLVVEEKTFLLSGWSDVYEKKYGIFIKQIEGEISNDDGFRPFSNEAYKLQWINENTVIINYSFGLGGGWESEVINFK